MWNKHTMSIRKVSRLPAFLESLMPLKNWCSIHARCSKSSLKNSIRFCGIFPSLKQDFLANHSSKVSDCVFEIHKLWQSGFSRVYSNCCCSCSFKPEIIKIGQSSYNMYSNNRPNFQETATIVNAHTKKVWKLIVCNSYIYIYIYIYIARERVVKEGNKRWMKTTCAEFDSVIVDAMKFH